MKLSHSKSSKVKERSSDDDDTGTKKKVKRSKSVFFDPTTQVSHPFPDLIWKMTFRRLPEAERLTGGTLPSEDVMDLLHCSLLSWAIYFKKSKRSLPPNLSNVVIECTKSDYYRVPYFVVNSEELDTIFISFRGSSCFKDWHVDFLAAAIQFGHAYVHEGVYFTALNIFNDIKDQIRDLSKSHNNRQIITVGHSLGGAVAGMISVLFNQEVEDLNVRAVCLAPVACLSPEIWEESKSYIKSYINYGDLVPFISYYNTYHLPENSLPKLTHDQLVHWCIKKINKHSKRQEFRLLVETYTRPVTEPYKLIPPGISSLIRIVDKKNATVEIQPIEDPLSYFGQFVKNLSAMKHPIKFYKHSIIRFVCQFFDNDEKLINYYELSRKSSKSKHKHKRRRLFRRRKSHKKEKEENDKKGSKENSTENSYENSYGASLSSNENSNENQNKNDNNDSNDNDNKNRKSGNSTSDDDENNQNYNDDDDDDDDDDDNQNESSSSDDDDNYDDDEDENEKLFTSENTRKSSSDEDEDEKFYSDYDEEKNK